MEKVICVYCERTIESIAQESFGVAHAGTNSVGNTICWGCVENAYGQMKDRAAVIKEKAEEVVRDIEANVPYDGPGCDCKCCRLTYKLDKAGYEINHSLERPSATKH